MKPRFFNIDTVVLSNTLRALPLDAAGAHVQLLLAAWADDGTLPNDHTILARIVGVSVRKWKSIWDSISSLWINDSTGNRVVNQPLFDARSAINADFSVASRKAKKAASARWKTKQPMHEHCSSNAWSIDKEKKEIRDPDPDSPLRGSRSPQAARPPLTTLCDSVVNSDLDQGGSFCRSGTGASTTLVASGEISARDPYGSVAPGTTYQEPLVLTPPPAHEKPARVEIAAAENPQHQREAASPARGKAKRAPVGSGDQGALETALEAFRMGWEKLYGVARVPDPSDRVVMGRLISRLPRERFDSLGETFARYFADGDQFVAEKHRHSLRYFASCDGLNKYSVTVISVAPSQATRAAMREDEIERILDERAKKELPPGSQPVHEYLWRKRMREQLRRVS